MTASKLRQTSPEKCGDLAANKEKIKKSIMKKLFFYLFKLTHFLFLSLGVFVFSNFIKGGKYELVITLYDLIWYSIYGTIPWFILLVKDISSASSQNKFSE
jgi:hypothetical protein